jgi:hypothetical protein
VGQIFPSTRLDLIANSNRLVVLCGDGVALDAGGRAHDRHGYQIANAVSLVSFIRYGVGHGDNRFIEMLDHHSHCGLDVAIHQGLKQRFVCALNIFYLE